MPPGPSLETSDFLETRSVQLEWKVTNLRAMFDATKGEVKSKCIKSPLFDQSRWQIFLYPNSGHDQYVSLYLSCEPTQTEKERALSEKPDLAATVQAGGSTDARVGKDNGKDRDRMPWKRDGHFKFSFEARSVDRRVTFKSLEADEHHFTHKTRNWGYQSFWKRSEAFYNNPSTRSADAFLIICTIVSAPVLPTTPPLPHLLVPKTLISAYASMFDDPDYSDVVFRIRSSAENDPGSTRPSKRKRERRLYAAKKVLAGRSEYFDTMLNSGFNESTFSIAGRTSANRRPGGSQQLRELEDDGEVESGSDTGDGGEDSDLGWDEDDDSGEDEDREPSELEGEEVDDAGGSASSRHISTGPSNRSVQDGDGMQTPMVPALARAQESLDVPARSRTSSAALSDDERTIEIAPASTPPLQRQDSVRSEQNEDVSDAEEEAARFDASSATTRHSRYVDATSAPGSPVKPARGTARAVTTSKPAATSRPRRPVDDRPRFEVVVTDAAYSTFRGLLHYLYTDSIQFAPLASSYYAARDHAAATDQLFAWPSRRAFLLAHVLPQAYAASASLTGNRAVGPCSAKAIYRLADKMGLVELKERAYEHIVQSLTPQNIVYEVFGSFSTRFDEIRRVEIAYLLEKWNEVRSSAQMRTVFDYLRTSRFPGFEDVWFEIMQNLEVKIAPTPTIAAAGPTASTNHAEGAGSFAAPGTGSRTAAGLGDM